MNLKKFTRHMTANDCLFAKHGGGHDLWRNSLTGCAASVPRHKELDPDTMKAICKQLGIPVPREK